MPSEKTGRQTASCLGLLKFWDGASAGAAGIPVPRDLRAAFDTAVDLSECHGYDAAAAAVLCIAARMTDTSWIGPGIELRPEDTDRDEPPSLDLLPDGCAVSLWRCHDGWLALPATGRTSWRDFCATFLNITAYRETGWETAWRTASVNSLATTVLDTHRVEDAVGTCLTYQIPATAVTGWLDAEVEYPAGNLAEKLAWAAIVSRRQMD